MFGRDLIFNTQHIANWEEIRQRKQKLIKQNNVRENDTRLPHTYQVGDMVLMRSKAARKLELPYKGPYKITDVFRNGTVRIQIGPVEDRVNIRNIVPYVTEDEEGKNTAD